MHISKLTSLATLPSSILAISVTYSNNYNGSFPVNQLACWKEGVGLMPGYDGWKTVGNIPPRVMAFDTVEEPDSPSCASCWELVYGQESRAFLVVDRAETGIILSLEGMNSLTGDKAEELGRVDVNATQVDMINCGIWDPPSEELWDPPQEELYLV
ncbi:hypothetical protein ACJZ2D_014106 [Fusarium nematophilum]